MKTIKTLDDYRSRKFNELIQPWKEQQKSKGNDYSDKALANELQVSRQSIVNWKKGKEADKYNKERLCKFFGVDNDYFDLIDSIDRWQFDEPFVTAKANDRSNYAREIGFDMRLLSVLRKLINFEEEFPIYSNIVQTNNKEFIRNPNYLDSQTIQEEELKDLQIQREDQTITLHNVDLMFLKEVQDQVVKYVKFLFYERSKEMLAEIQSINKDYIRDYVVITVDGNPIPDNEKLAFLNNKAQPFDSVEGFENALQNARESTSNKKEVHIEFKPIDIDFKLKHDRFMIATVGKDGTDNG